MNLLIVSFNDDETTVVKDIADYLSRKYNIAPTRLSDEQDVMFANPFSRIVINKNGSVRNLTAKEFDLLYYLFINKGQVFTNEQIYDHVWEHDAGFNPRSLSSFICRLRKKVEPNPKQPIYILTVRGVGYKFNDEGAIG